MKNARLQKYQDIENPNRRRLGWKIGRVLREEIADFHPRLAVATVLFRLLPPFVGNRLRAMVLRSIGFKIGRGTVIWGAIQLTGGGNIYGRLVIGRECWFNGGCHLDLEAPITIGDHVAVGHEALILTSSHAIGPAWRRAGALQRAEVRIGDGAWLGARCMILPGITIGAGAVVAAGAVVTKDVPENTLVAGVPARLVRNLL